MSKLIGCAYSAEKWWWPHHPTSDIWWPQHPTSERWWLQTPSFGQMMTATLSFGKKIKLGKFMSANGLLKGVYTSRKHRSTAISSHGLRCLRRQRSFQRCWACEWPEFVFPWDNIKLPCVTGKTITPSYAGNTRPVRYEVSEFFHMSFGARLARRHNALEATDAPLDKCSRCDNVHRRTCDRSGGMVLANTRLISWFGLFETHDIFADNRRASDIFAYFHNTV